MVLAVFPGQIAPYSPTYIGFPRALGPSGAHWLGTTSQGQDIYSQLIWGARYSLILAIAAGGLATLIGPFLGQVAGLLDDVDTRDGIRLAASPSRRASISIVSGCRSGSSALGVSTSRPTLIPCERSATTVDSSSVRKPRTGTSRNS